jgi:hypothetical protein
MKKRYLAAFALAPALSQCQPACTPQTPAPTETTAAAPAPPAPLPLQQETTTTPAPTAGQPTVNDDDFVASLVYAQMICGGHVIVGLDADAPDGYDRVDVHLHVTQLATEPGVTVSYVVPMHSTRTADAFLHLPPASVGYVIAGTATFVDNDGVLPNHAGVDAGQVTEIPYNGNCP